jgi:phosphoribosyl-AMP cyclohydrolase
MTSMDRSQTSDNAPSTNIDALIDAVTFDADGLVAAIAQDDDTGQVLMMAYMTAETLRQTFETGTMTYWSRSREAVWVKGATSGHTQAVRSARLDCDGDALLFRVEQLGGACHTGHRSCFYRRAERDGWTEDGTSVFDPDAVYG